MPPQLRVGGRVQPQEEETFEFVDEPEQEENSFEFIDEPKPVAKPTTPVKPPKKYAGSEWGLPSMTDIGASILKAPISLGESAVGLLDIPTLGRAGKLLESTTGYDPEMARRGIDELLPPSEQLKEQRLKFQEAEGLTAKGKAALTSPALLGTTILESAPSLLGAAGAGRAAAKILPKASKLALSAAGGGAYTAGSMAEELRQESPTGVLTPKEAGMSLLTGAASGGVTVGLGKVANILGVPDIDQIIIKAAKDPTFRASVLRSLALGGATESVEESFQSAVERASKNLTKGEPLLKGVPEESILGGVSGFALGGGAAAHHAWKPDTKVPSAAPGKPAEELDLLGTQPLVKQVPWRKTPDEILREAGGPALDPRVSGIGPEPERLAVPELGPEAIAGPVVEGARVSPGEFTDQALGAPIDLGAEMAKIEAARAAAKQEVEQEFTPEEIAAAKERRGKKAEAVKPTTVIVKKDIPATVNELLAQGYKFLGTTPEGNPKMVKELPPEMQEEEEMEGPLFQRVKKPDQGPKSMVDMNYEYADKLREQGKIEEADALEENIKKAVENDADEMAVDLKEGWPDRADEIDSVHREQDPEIIARNFMNYDEMMQTMAAHANDAMPPAARKAFDDSYEEIGMLHALAYAKYVRATQRLNEGRMDFARTPEGMLKIGSNIKRQAGELTTGYNTALPGIMMREAMQNAIDAVKSKGSAGKIRVKAYEDGFEISDNGKGMSLEEIETVFTNLHESGKVSEAGAAGGKGVGKASYMLGGQYFYGETVTMENGKPVKYIIQGAPEDLMEGFKEERIEMPAGTPTGTLVRTLYKPDQTGRAFYASSMLSDITRYSMGQKATIESINFGTFGEEKAEPHFFEQPWKKPGTEMGSTDLVHSDVGVFLPPESKNGNRTSIQLKVLNNGMYQYDTYLYLDEEVPDMPNILVVNVSPKVEEFDEQGRPNDQYPFPVQRESLKDIPKREVEAFIKDTLIAPKLQNRKAKLKEIYDNLTFIPVRGAVRKTVFFDPGDRLTPEEKMSFVNNPQVIQMADALDVFMNDILLSSEDPKAINRLEGVGIVMDPNMHGVHIPNPSSTKENPKSIILFNFFGAMENNKSPLAASLEIGVTAMHEGAHVGLETPISIPMMRDEDLSDPRVGTFLQTYIRETQAQGGADLGHGIAFIKRLGDLYVRTGAKTWLRNTDRIRRVLTNKSGGYHSEFTRLLSLYKESRGRDATTEDYLSGTGVKHAAAGGGTGNVPGGTSGPRSGTSLPKEITVKQMNKQISKALVGLGYEASGESSPQGDPIWRLSEQGELGWRDILHAPKGLMSVDLPFFTSAGFRQGLPMIGANFAGWAKAWYNSARAYGAPHSYQMIMSDISKHPYFRRRPQPDGTIKESLATEIGLAMSDLGAFTKREEVINSKLGEKIKGYGLHIAASNRAYTAYLNTLRAHSLIRFANQAKEDSRSIFGYKIPGRDIEQDLPLAMEMADAINTLTGRGKLKLNIWGDKVAINLERAAKGLTSVFFSPRLQASRVKMLNPAAYVNMDPFVRKMYLKGLFSAIGTWWTLASLMELLGMDVNKDPNNADFGKGRVGNTRIDPGGGFQQLMVLFSRLRPEWFRVPTEVPFPPYGELVEDPGGGKFTSSTSGETNYFGEGYPPRSRGDVLQQFVESKLDPTAKFAWDLFNADRQRPFSLADRTIQLALPIMTSDLVEIINEDPTLLPLVMIPSTIGMGASTYEGGKPEPSIIPPEWDIAIGEP